MAWMIPPAEEFPRPSCEWDPLKMQSMKFFPFSFLSAAYFESRTYSSDFKSNCWFQIDFEDLIGYLFILMQTYWKLNKIEWLKNKSQLAKWAKLSILLLIIRKYWSSILSYNCIEQYGDIQFGGCVSNVFDIPLPYRINLIFKSFALHKHGTNCAFVLYEYKSHSENLYL